MPAAASADAARLTPEKVADGAPVTPAAVGAACVITQSDITIFLNDQSVPPSPSCKTMSKR